jgi:hypothetical protein
MNTALQPRHDDADNVNGLRVTLEINNECRMKTDVIQLALDVTKQLGGGQVGGHVLRLQ